MRIDYKKQLVEYREKQTPEKLKFLQELTLLEIRTRDLKRIKDITNACLVCGAYSEKNLEKQINSMDNARSPKWEIKILKEVYNLERIESHKIFRELKSIMKEYRKSYNTKEKTDKTNKKSLGDLQKEMRKNVNS